MIKKPNPLQNFLLFSAGVNPKLLDYQKHTTVIMEESALGVFVLVTSLFAFFTSLLAVNYVTNDFWASAPVALLWAVFIFTFDRTLLIFSHDKNPLHLVIRIIIAAFLSLGLSIPIELQVFKKEIDETLKTMNIEKNTQDSKSIDVLISEDAKKRDDKKKQIRDFEQKMSNYITRETENRTRIDLPVMVRFNNDKIYQAERKQYYKENLDSIKQSRKDVKDYELKIKKQENNKFNSKSNKENEQINGLLDRMFASNRYLNQKEGGIWTSWYFKLFLFIIEIMPILTKYFRRDSMYSLMIKAEGREFENYYEQNVIFNIEKIKIFGEKSHKTYMELLQGNTFKDLNIDFPEKEIQDKITNTVKRDLEKVYATFHSNNQNKIRITSDNLNLEKNDFIDEDTIVIVQIFDISINTLDEKLNLNSSINDIITIASQISSDLIESNTNIIMHLYSSIGNNLDIILNRGSDINYANQEYFDKILKQTGKYFSLFDSTEIIHNEIVNYAIDYVEKDNAKAIFFIFYLGKNVDFTNLREFEESFKKYLTHGLNLKVFFVVFDDIVKYEVLKKLNKDYFQVKSLNEAHRISGNILN